jgi:LuxR family transcriptional regulator, maltose regulon positive regulatory protein
MPPIRHVPRPRLVRVLAGAPLAIIEAGGGYGKSVLASQLRGELEIASAEASLERETTEPQQLIGALRRGLRRAGLSDAAAAITGSSSEQICEALARTSGPVLIVVDEVQRATGAAAGLLADLAADIVPEHRLVLVGRRLDARLRAVGVVPDVTRLEAADLAFDAEELASLLAATLGREPSAADVDRLERLTGGWPAAAALAVAGLARSPERGAHDAIAGVAPLGALVDELLDTVPSDDRRRIAELAHLPLLSDDVAAACSGAGSLELLSGVGFPLRSTRRVWRELPEPVRDELAARAPLPAGAARAAARAYADSGELATGLAVLAAAGDHHGVAELLAGRRWQELAALDLAELRAVLTTLPAGALAAHPFALVQVARIAEQEADLELRRELLERALGLVFEPQQRREVEAELVVARAVTEPGDEVEAKAQAVLARIDGSERGVRARALTALARVEAWRGDPASMLSAERRLGEAAALCRLAGEVEWEAQTLIALGYRVAFARGDLEQAIERMEMALALLPGAGSERAAAATFLADALAYAGRFDEAEAALREAVAIARRLGDHRVQAYAAWTGVTLASLRGDPASTIQRIRTVELHPGDWFEHPTGIEFLADATLALARAGLQDPASEYAARASERASAAGLPEIAWVAAGAVEARWGDPDRAEAALASFASSPQQAPRDEWRTLLFRALAATRRDDGDAATLAARAYEAAAELGRADLPSLHEPDVAAAVAPLALAAGSRSVVVGDEPRGYLVTVLGGFGVEADGRALEPPPGRPSTLVKLLALAGAPVPAAEAIEELWPEVDETTGRRRLRNLLNRLRAACGELVVRDGDALTLAPGTEVDARGFEDAALAMARAPVEARPGLARTALARYRGELLPADRYEPWATAHRERLRRRHLELLDLLAEDAVERGDVDEAIRLLDSAQLAEPLDESRYLRAAELLLFQGRRGSAQVLIERARRVTRELGLAESPRLARLGAAVGRA